jgi:hypothetical protein
MFLFDMKMAAARFCSRVLLPQMADKYRGQDLGVAVSAESRMTDL